MMLMLSARINSAFWLVEIYSRCATFRYNRFIFPSIPIFTRKAKMSNNKMNPSTLACSFWVSAEWQLTYVDPNPPKKGKSGRVRNPTRRAGNIQTLSYTSKGVVDNQPGQALVLVSTDRQQEGSLPLGFQAKLLDLTKIPTDVRTRLARGKPNPSPIDIARKFVTP